MSFKWIELELLRKACKRVRELTSTTTIVATTTCGNVYNLDGWGCDFCFVMSCFVGPLVVSVTSADSILSYSSRYKTIRSQLYNFVSCLHHKSFFLTSTSFFAYFMPLLGWMYSLFVSYRSFLRLFAHICAHSACFCSFSLIPALSGVSVHSLTTSSFLAGFSDSCDFYNYVPPGCVFLFIVNPSISSKSRFLCVSAMFWRSSIGFLISLSSFFSVFSLFILVSFLDKFGI